MLQETLHYLNSVFELKEEAFNPKALKIIKEPYEQTASYSKYKGKVIAPTQIWATDVGRGAEPIVE